MLSFDILLYVFIVYIYFVKHFLHHISAVHSWDSVASLKGFGGVSNVT